MDPYYVGMVASRPPRPRQPIRARRRPPARVCSAIGQRAHTTESLSQRREVFYHYLSTLVGARGREPRRKTQDALRISNTDAPTAGTEDVERI
jgi:hypothetical protein